MVSEKISVIIEGEDRTGRAFKSVKSRMGGLASSAGTVLSTIGKFGAVLGGAAVGAVTLLGKSALTSASAFEQSEIAFTTMLGSAEKAQELLGEITDFAKKTPFSLEGVERSSRQLLAVGFSAKEVIPTLKSIGDVSAGLGLGEEGLQRLILNLGQVKTQGKLTGRELRDFAVAGVPIIDELSKNLGVAKEEVAGLVSKGLVSSDEVLNAFASMSSEGGKFGDLMSKQSDTAAGRFSNLKDTLQILLREIGQSLLPLASSIVSTLSSAFEFLSPKIKTFVDFFVSGINRVKEFLGPLIERMMFEFAPVLTNIKNTLVESFQNIDFSKFKDSILLVFNKLIANKDKIQNIFQNMIKGVGFLLNAFISLQSIIIKTGLLDRILTTMDLISTVFSKTAGFISTIVSGIESIVDFIKGPVFSKFADTFGGIKEFGSAVLGRGKGSPDNEDFISRPGMTPQSFSPQDTIIGVKRPQDLMGGGGITVNIGTVSGANEEILAEALQERLSTLITT